MIKSNEGNLSMNGTKAELIADLGIIILGFLEAKINKDDLEEIMKKAIDDYEKEVE